MDEDYEALENSYIEPNPNRTFILAKISSEPQCEQLLYKGNRLKAVPGANHKEICFKFLTPSVTVEFVGEDIFGRILPEVKPGSHEVRYPYHFEWLNPRAIDSNFYQSTGVRGFVFSKR